MQANLQTGAVLAGHRLEAIVGQGGMGVLYRATHLALDRPVALKVIVPTLAADSAFRERFKRESRIAASIDHPNVIPIYHAGEEDGVLFITMRYVRGTDLRGLIDKRGALEPPFAAEIVDAIGAALDAAHAHGLVHRDVKPANILIEGLPDRPHVYLTDFGLTKRVASTSGVTRTGQFVGTLDYVAPEQIQATHVDGRTDVYALGCVLFETLTGRVPYPVVDEAAKLYAHLGKPPPVVSEHRPDAPAALDEVIFRAMAKAPDDRYASAGEVGKAAIAAGTSAATRVSRRRSPETIACERERPRAEVARLAAPPAAAEAPPPPARRRGGRLPVLAGVALLAVALALAGFLLLPAGDTEPTSIPVGRDPQDLAIGAGSVWVVNEGDRTVFRVGAETGTNDRRAITRFRGLDPLGVAVGGGSAWVTTSDRRLIRIDPATNRFSGDPVRLSGDAAAIAVGAGAVWVADGVRSVVRVDADSDGARTTAIPVGRSPSRIAVGEGAVWVIHSDGGKVSRIDPRSGRVAGAPIEVTPGSAELAAGEGGVWVSNPEQRTIARIDPGSNRADAPLRLQTAPTDLAVGEGAVWLTSSDGRAVIRVDPRTSDGNPRAHRLAGAPDHVAVGEGAVWVTLPEANAVTRLDPAAFGDQ